MALQKETKQNLIKEFAINPGDSGSSAVQIALTTERIRLLSEHLHKHAKDNSSKRGLMALIAQRKTLLAYLQRKNEPQYKEILKRLGLKK